MRTYIPIWTFVLAAGLLSGPGTEFASAGGTCQSMESISCGSADFASTQGLVNKITTYNCSTWNESGPEYVYSFVPQGSGQVTAMLSDTTADLDVFVLQGTCGQNSCIAYGDNSATFNAVSGTQYYIVVDGYAGESGSFTLSVICGWVCEGMSAIGCGDSDSWSTAGFVNNITTYNCTSWNESGPEYVYSFVPQGNGQVTATLSNMTADLDIFVLRGTCEQNTCIAYGNNSATFNAVSGTQYYIIVDGYGGESGEYTIDVACSGGMCEAMDSILCGQTADGNTQGLPNYITTYNCIGWNESGPEYVFSFIPQWDGSVTATLFSYADLDVFILGSSCDQNSCIAYGDSSATFDASGGVQYYIVADGFAGEAGEFSLELTCEGSAPCLRCGGVPHWVDNCTGASDNIDSHAGRLELDQNLDCKSDLTLFLPQCGAPSNLMRIDRSNPRDDSATYPGLRPIDGHLDVIDTEIVSMCLGGGGTELRAGLLQGLSNASTGAAAELSGYPDVAESFFDVFFEIQISGGQKLYNQTAMRVSTAAMECIWPQVIYAYNGCLGLYTSQIPGQGTRTANLIAGKFMFNPGSGPMCEVKLPGDIDGNCYVDFTDFALMADKWLECNNAMDPVCAGN